MSVIRVFEPVPNPSIFRLLGFLAQRLVRYPGAGYQLTEGCVCGYARKAGHGPSVDFCAHCCPDTPYVMDFDL